MFSIYEFELLFLMFDIKLLEFDDLKKAS